MAFSKLAGGGGGGGWQLRDLGAGLLQASVGVDVRSLALCRVALAWAVVVDLAMRARDAGALLGDDGVVPRRLVLGMADGGQRASLYLAVSTVLLHLYSGN